MYGFVDDYLFFRPFSLGLYIVCPLIYGFWWTLWYLQTFHQYLFKSPHRFQEDYQTCCQSEQLTATKISNLVKRQLTNVPVKFDSFELCGFRGNWNVNKFTDDERKVMTMVHITFERTYDLIYNYYLMSISFFLNCQEDPSTKTQVISRYLMCLQTDDNNNNPNHHTTTYSGHIKLDRKKHSYNYQFYVVLFRG